jgi:hypothetical protein
VWVNRWTALPGWLDSPGGWEGQGGAPTEQLLHVLLRVGDGSAGNDEGGATRVAGLADSPQSPQHQSSVRSKHAPANDRFLDLVCLSQTGPPVPSRPPPMGLPILDTIPSRVHIPRWTCGPRWTELEDLSPRHHRSRCSAGPCVRVYGLGRFISHPDPSGPASSITAATQAGARPDAWVYLNVCSPRHRWAATQMDRVADVNVSQMDPWLHGPRQQLNASLLNK